MLHCRIQRPTASLLSSFASRNTPSFADSMAQAFASGAKHWRSVSVFANAPDANANMAMMATTTRSMVLSPSSLNAGRPGPSGEWAARAAMSVGTRPARRYDGTRAGPWSSPIRAARFAPHTRRYSAPNPLRPSAAPRRPFARPCAPVCAAPPDGESPPRIGAAGCAEACARVRAAF